MSCTVGMIVKASNSTSDASRNNGMPSVKNSSGSGGGGSEDGSDEFGLSWVMPRAGCSFSIEPDAERL